MSSPGKISWSFTVKFPHHSPNYSQNGGHNTEVNKKQVKNKVYTLTRLLYLIHNTILILQVLHLLLFMH